MSVSRRALVPRNTCRARTETDHVVCPCVHSSKHDNTRCTPQHRLCSRDAWALWVHWACPRRLEVHTHCTQSSGAASLAATNGAMTITQAVACSTRSECGESLPILTHGAFLRVHDRSSTFNPGTSPRSRRAETVNTCVPSTVAPFTATSLANLSASF